MLMKIKRLILKPFGGKANLVSTLIITIIGYLFLRTYLFSNYSTVVQNRLEVQNLPNSFAEKKKFDKECEISEACGDNTIPYKIKSGEGMDKYPVICFDGKLIVSKSLENNKIGRGLNLVNIRKKNDSYEVESIHTFDTYAEDAGFYRFLKTSTLDGDIIMIASYDEATNGLKDILYNLLESFGAKSFRNVKFRDSYAMIGQRGIPKGNAIEIVQTKGKNEFGATAKLTGCLKLPLGPITPIPYVEPQINNRSQIVIGEIVPNCGLPEPCALNEFSVHIFTGLNDKDEPKICIDGKYVMAKGLNDAGRGLNVVVIGNGKEILKTAHFDTYQEDSTSLEIFLENLYDKVIVIICTFDEASSKLGQLAKNLLFDLGSGLVQNLRHRDAWYMIGQKGIKGFSPIEEISYSGPEHNYPQPLNKKMCVSQTIQGMKIRPDPLPVTNKPRRDFCQKFDGYGDFCFDHNVDQQLKPVPLINKTLEDHPVYSIPILIVAGLSHNSLRMCLETIVMQPGINAQMVFVALDEKFKESIELVNLFGFNVLLIKTSDSYIEQMHKSIDTIWLQNTTLDKQAVIIIEEDIIVSPDFLYFFAQIYEVFMSDDSLMSVSSWNPNSFSELEGSEKLVYRTNDFPGFGFLIKKTVYERFMKNKLENCCNNRVWYKWRIDSNDKIYSLMPDVSRSYRRPYSGINSDRSFLENLFNRARKTNLIPFPEIDNLNDLANKEDYDKSIKRDLTKAFEFTNLINCEANSLIVYPPQKGIVFKIIYEQTSLDDYKSLKKLCKCFGLFYDSNHEPMGLYNGVLKFHAQGNDYIFIGSLSQFLNQ